MRLILLLPLVVPSITVDLAAQQSPRDYDGVTSFVTIGQIDGLLGVGPAASQDPTFPPETLVWQQTGPEPVPATGTTATLTLPFDYPDTIAEVSQGSYLVAGWSTASGTGKLVAVTLDVTSSPHSLVGSDRDLGVIDPRSVVWNSADSKIYLLDQLGDQLLCANWVPGQNLPSSFTPILAAPQTQPLQSSAAANLLPPASGSGVIIQRADDRTREWEVVPSGATWTVVETALVPQPPTSVLVSDPLTANARWPVRIQGPAGSFNVIDLESGLTVTSGVLPVAYQWWEFSGGPPLAAGHRYAIQGSNGVLSQPFLAIDRIGDPDVEGVLTMARANVSWGDAYVASTDLTVIADATVDGVSSQFVYDASAYLIWAARLSGAPDPVTWVGTPPEPVLQPDAVLGPFPVHLAADATTAPLSANFPIPNDPALAGVWIYFQWGLPAPDGASAYSDVIALPVTGGPVGLSSTAGSAQTTSASRAMKSWRSSLSNPIGNAAYRQLLESKR